MRTGSLLFIAMLLLLLLYQQMQYPQIRLNPITTRLTHPLDTRLHFKIGDVDPRFHLSRSELEELAQQAANIWQQGTGRSWFVYDPHARLAINFIYDQRQEQTTQRLTALEKIQNTQNQQQFQEQEINQHKSEIEQSQQLIDAKQTSFQQQVQQYNQFVEQINRQGGASPELKQQIEQQKQALEQMKAELNQMVMQHNQLVSQSNFQVQSYNQINQNINQTIQTYNQEYAARPFDKGLFNGHSINIYEFENQDDLRLVIAHELGHALGLPHTEHNSHALMYPLLKDQNMHDFQLTMDDRQLLKENSVWDKFLNTLKR
ncbi:matrixin family metalloprotease [Acinetobacter sp. MB5]|uniref:matrixin family metalloprotease n=1 Tax=Acinetobacter sp. MB5 TaxID=2069438 RepID=UPI000DD08D2B|nr:matrixin family metalloprotease [Acinetobacter sp. MB5]